MIAVIFEVVPLEGRLHDYLTIAAALRPELEQIKGFISIERFQSLANPDKILSLSFWDNEESVIKWRNTEAHRLAQAKGRESVLSSYKLKVATVQRSYTMKDRTEAPTDSNVFHIIDLK